jgi:hypothetical protein
MKNEIQFRETQRFNQWWLWLLLLGIKVRLIFEIFSEQQFGNNPMNNIELLIAIGIIIMVTTLFLTFRLDTKINNDGIFVRFFPIHIKFKHYSWYSLTKVFVRQYSPIFEYGGWGLRGLFGNNSAYNISGDKGLQLEFTDGKKILIGTNKASELKEVLVKIGQLKQ